MNDYYLKASGESEMMAALTAAGATSGRSHDYALDVIGTVYEPTGQTLTDSEGIEYPEMEAQDGWHVNYRGEALPAELQPFEIDAPSTPVRVWA